MIVRARPRMVPNPITTLPNTVMLLNGFMEPRTAASIARAADKVRRHVEQPHRASALGLTLGRTTAPTEMMFVRYPPCLAIVLTGRKRTIDSHPRNDEWGSGRFLITPVNLPLIAQVTATGDDGDFLSLNWQLDPAIVSEVAAQLPRQHTHGDIDRLGTMTADLADALDRLLGLLDTPEDSEVLLPLISREIILRLLQSDQAPRLHAAVEHSRASTIDVVVTQFQDRLAHPWTVDEAAAVANVSAATLTRHFRDLTGLTPMRYLKRMRLGEARRHLLTSGATATQAAAAVGYASTAHFSRDYRTAYNTTPAADSASHRGRYPAAN